MRASRFHGGDIIALEISESVLVKAEGDCEAKAGSWLHNGKVASY